MCKLLLIQQMLLSPLHTIVCLSSAVCFWPFVKTICTSVILKHFASRCAGQTRKCDAAGNAKQALGERREAEAAQGNRDGEQGSSSS